MSFMFVMWMLLVLGYDPNYIPDCPVEDSIGQPVCVWDARTQGNGQGQSYAMIWDVKVWLS